MSPNEIEILLVEDNPADLELTLRTLRRAKLANCIHIARDGEEALGAVFSRASGSSPSTPLPSLILLDLNLPKIDGLEFLQALKSDARTGGIPVIVMTSSREQEASIARSCFGAMACIRKPVGFAQFTDIVREVGLAWAMVQEPQRASRLPAYLEPNLS